MTKQTTIPLNSLIYYRLIALWALAEAMLGGIIHGFKIPVSGLVVGSCAIICICLIAWYVPKKGSILKATIIVAVFKMMLSPQSPPPAYVAVFFQGLIGELLFWNRRFFKLSCILLAVLALLESGFQRILMLTIVYGSDLWSVINDFINGLTKQKTATNYSLLIGGGYVLLHLMVGIAVGWFAGVLPERVLKWRAGGSPAVGSLSVRSPEVDNTILNRRNGGASKRRGVKKGLFVMWIILMALYVQSYLNIGTPLLPPHVSLKILLRSMIIVLTWYFVLLPLLQYLLHRWLQKKKTQSQPEIQKVVELLPNTQQLVAQSWRQAGGRKGWARLVRTAKLILVNALDPDQTKQVIILSGPSQTGKTTSLVIWSGDRKDVSGILTPVIDGKRILMNTRTRLAISMEAGPEEKEVLTVGRFVFSKNNFDIAVQIIRDATVEEGWLVIDEIGPLELRGEGFADALKEVLVSGNKEQKILLVVRGGMVEKVKEYFQIRNAVVISSMSELNNNLSLAP
jgi:nucleoside-triphosphatase THEP1/ABC-type thiamin/hydroxymethylpyrimidine transport system permease subunit